MKVEMPSLSARICHWNSPNPLFCLNFLGWTPNLSIMELCVFFFFHAQSHSPPTYSTLANIAWSYLCNLVINLCSKTKLRSTWWIRGALCFFIFRSNLTLTCKKNKNVTMILSGQTFMKTSWIQPRTPRAQEDRDSCSLIRVKPT